MEKTKFTCQNQESADCLTVLKSQMRVSSWLKTTNCVLMVDPLQRMVDKTGTEETLGNILKGGVEDRKHQRARIKQPVSVV